MTPPTDKDAPVAGKWVPVEPTISMVAHGTMIQGGLTAKQAQRCYRAMYAAAPSSPVVGREELATEVMEWLCELPDRTSPEEYPDMMLVTADEVTSFILARLHSPVEGNDQ